MPGTFYMPVLTPVEAVRPRTDSTSESQISKSDSDNPGFDKILECKTKEEVLKSEEVQGSSNDKSRRPRTRSINGQDHTEPDSKQSAMESTLSKAFGENRGLTTQDASESGQTMNGIPIESRSDGNSAIMNPIAMDTRNSGSGMISNFNGIIQSNENVVEGIGPPGGSNSPPQDSIRIETAGPRGNDQQNPQPDITRITEEADASKAQREASVRTTPVFDWVRRNFKAPAGEITRGNTDRSIQPNMQDSKPVVAESNNDSKQSLADAMPNSQPAVKASGDPIPQPPTDILSEIKPVTDFNRSATDQRPEIVPLNVKPAETAGTMKTVSGNTEQSGVNVLSNSKPDVDITQGAVIRPTGPVSTDPALNSESLRVDADQVPKTVLQDVKPGNETPRIDTDKAPMVVLQEIKITQEVPRTEKQDAKSGNEIPRVEAEQSQKPSAPNEPLPKQETPVGETTRNNTTSKNPDSASSSSEVASSDNTAQKDLNPGAKVVNGITPKGIATQSENPTSAVPSVSNTENPSTVVASTSDPSVINVKVDEPVSVLGNAPVRIATEIQKSATDELPFGGKAVLKIELSPPRLGRMNIELVKMADGIDVKLVVRTAFARDLLMQRGEEIKTALHDQGIDVKRFSIVETGSSRDNSQQNMSGFESSTSSHQNDGQFRESQETTDNSALIPNEESDEDGPITDSAHIASNRNNSGGLNILA
jgi:hypothetical protein